MKHRVACLMVAGLALACEAPRVTASEPSPSVEILVGGTPQPPLCASGPLVYRGAERPRYAIQLRNPFGVRVAVALSVDGLNTIDARQTTAADARKWVLDPYETVTISGWQTSRTEARRFEFTTEERSYGQALGKTANFGVISAVFFKERVPEVRTADESARAQAQQPAAAPRSELDGQARRRRICGDRDGPQNRPRRHASAAESRRRACTHGEHPLRVPPAVGAPRHPARGAGARSAASSRASTRLRARLCARSAVTQVSTDQRLIGLP